MPLAPARHPRKSGSVVWQMTPGVSNQAIETGARIVSTKTARRLTAIGPLGHPSGSGLALLGVRRGFFVLRANFLVRTQLGLLFRLGGMRPAARRRRRRR